jgi:hypothetical protein
MPQVALEKGEELPQVPVISLERFFRVPALVTKERKPSVGGLTQIIAEGELEAVFSGCCQKSWAHELMRTSFLYLWLSDS